MSKRGAEVLEAITVSSSSKLEEGKGLQRSFSLLLFAVFIIVDLLALMAGTSSYGSLNRMQQATDDRIKTVGPIISSVRATDAADSVRRSSDAPEGDALVLVESDAQDTYETRIYLYKGKILQEYAIAESPYAPSKATELAESSVFEFSYDDGLLTITTDAGVTKIALRNRQGGA